MVSEQDGLGRGATPATSADGAPLIRYQEAVGDVASQVHARHDHCCQGVRCPRLLELSPTRTGSTSGPGDNWRSSYSSPGTSKVARHSVEAQSGSSAAKSEKCLGVWLLIAAGGPSEVSSHRLAPALVRSPRLASDGLCGDSESRVSQSGPRNRGWCSQETLATNKPFEGPPWGFWAIRDMEATVILFCRTRKQNPWATLLLLPRRHATAPD
jgi:hypothetical protein